MNWRLPAAMRRMPRRSRARNIWKQLASFIYIGSASSFGGRRKLIGMAASSAAAEISGKNLAAMPSQRRSPLL